jgi:ABC-type Zn uptake system ZnuABC Zn-binding protein ZnuA
MKKKLIIAGILLVLLSACGQAAPTPTPRAAEIPLKVLAVETFLTDIAQNVAGERAAVESLIPIGLDPHAFEPTPRDVARIAGSQVLIANGSGFEEWLQKVLDNAGGQRTVIEASTGLNMRVPKQGELSDHPGGGDPHFWLDPNNAIQYVENIRDGLTQADPPGAETYKRNADAYIAQLKELDAWIRQQVDQIPPARRLLVTNHESFGYFADRYGFQIVGAIVPSVSSSASPSAQQMAELVRQIRQSGAPAIFLETGTNPQLADQIAGETGAKVVTGLYSHSVTDPGGPAPTYIEMMRYNVSAIVDALK